MPLIRQVDSSDTPSPRDRSNAMARSRPHFWMSTRNFLLAACLIFGVVATASPASATGALPPVQGTAATAGATIVGEQWLTQRTLQLTVATDAFTAPVPVEVKFPTGYDASATRHWPVTYYLAGTTHDQTTFRTAYYGEGLTASYPSIVVSPRGDSGYWSDWFNNSTGGPPEYETFVTQQLVPLIDANFRTIPDRAHRMVMGESMGGYGTAMFGARHPDEFAAVASLSGASDSNWPAGATVLSASPTLQGAPPDSIYGPLSTEAVRWHGHNPTDLAENLAGVDVQIFTGNGVLGTAEGETATDGGGCSLESGIIRPESVSLHNTLLALGIPHGWHDLPWGCHSPTLFEYEIAQAIQRFDTVLADPPAPPATFDYRSIEPAFSVWGWSVNADPNRALEFLDLHDVSASGLTVTGSGTTSITTPPLFNGKDTVTVTIDGTAATVRPDKAGRIRFAVNLGPADQQQQYNAGNVTDFRTSVVTFS
ncbi:alpha/beta hydrolase [Amycolatopsis nivea]|uniref:alpha/beta hydrolase n=1 Tax=Amycolatopsis nivea TaxID=1644109 RepID=UPI00106F18F9|nr:alpha/beta hydrolase-fold protein [Amycolatopsis nivea]